MPVTLAAPVLAAAAGAALGAVLWACAGAAGKVAAARVAVAALARKWRREPALMWFTAIFKK